MWYKYNEDNNEWYFGGEIHLPSGTILNSDNKEFKIDGWFWSEEEPLEYVKWKEGYEQTI